MHISRKVRYMTISFPAIHFFYDSVVFSRESLRRSICQGDCLFHNICCNQPLEQAVWFEKNRRVCLFQENHCGPAFLKVRIYSTELVVIIFVWKVLCQMPKSTYRDPIFHGECVSLTVLQQRLQIFIKYSKCFRKAIVDIALVIKDNYFGYLYKWLF